MSVEVGIAERIPISRFILLESRSVMALTINSEKFSFQAEYKNSGRSLERAEKWSYPLRLIRQ